MAWDNNAERKEHTRESAEVTISLDKEELEKIAAFAELDVDTMSVEDLAEALHGIVAEMEAPEQEQTVSKEEVIAWGNGTGTQLRQYFYFQNGTRHHRRRRQADIEGL